MELKPDTLLQGGKYRIVRTLGHGGFGITYEAVQVMMERRVCIKEFFVEEYCDRDPGSSGISLGSTGSAEMMKKYMAKFVKEAKTIARLNHPNIISIYDVFEENNTAYYVMEFLAGGSLNEWVKANGPMPEAQALDYVRQVGAALSYAHDRRVMHLDVKPSNIMLDGGRAVLIDFGLSKQYTETGEQTSSTPVGISHGYAPLEQYMEGGVKEFSPTTDVYSLGATLYKLLTGQTPPPAPIVTQSGLPPITGDISAAVVNAIERSMRFLKQERPRSVAEFLSLCKSASTVKDTPDPGASTAGPKSTVSEPKAEPEEDKTQKAFARRADSARTEPSPYGENRFPTFTIGFLVFGLLVGFAIIIGLGILVSAESAIYIPALVGAIVAELGVFLLLFQKKAGYWLLVGGGLSCALLVLSLDPSLSPSTKFFWRLFFSFMAILAFVDLSTYCVLRIKNKRGIPGWNLLS